MNPVIIQPANAQTDFDTIREIYFQTWQSAYQGLMPTAILEQLNRQQWHPEQRMDTTQLALVDQQIVGFCSYGPARRDRYARWGELYAIYVLPAYQHQGIGRQLLVPALQYLSTHFPSIYLEVLEKNYPAQHLYQSLGFRATQQKFTTPTSYGQVETVSFELKIQS